jgi:ribose transport system substrate-binding protein
MLFTLLILGGCRSSEPEPEPLRLILLPGDSGSFGKLLLEGARDEALNRNVDILFPREAVQADEEEQLAFLFRSFSSYPDIAGIMVHPSSSGVMDAVALYSEEHSLPVALVNSRSEKIETVIENLILIGSDHELGGRVAASHTAQLLDLQGDVYVSASVPDNVVQESRIRGFFSGIEGNPGMRMVGVDYSFGSPEQAFFQSLSMLQIRPGMSAIFAVDHSAMQGAYRFLRETGLLGSVRLVTWGYDNILIDAMKRGYVDAVVLEDPAAMGSLAVQHLSLFIREQKELPVQLITRTQLATAYTELEK